eukprot:4793383-Prymnesium_polylepis.1
MTPRAPYDLAPRAAACAIVPAYPNELTPPARVSSAASSVLCTGSPSLPERSEPPTCGLSARSCAFGAASQRSSRTNSCSSPVIPAAASACP